MKTFFETQAINMINTRFEERKLPGAFRIGNLSHCATLVFRLFAGSSKFKARGGCEETRNRGTSLVNALQRCCCYYQSV